MSRNVRLHPPAWRDRYGDELVALTGVVALILAWISIAGRSDGASATRLA